MYIPLAKTLHVLGTGIELHSCTTRSYSTACKIPYDTFYQQGLTEQTFCIC